MRETQLKLVYSKGRMCWPPSLLASILGEARARHLEPQVQTSTRHRLSHSLSLATALCTLPASPHTPQELLFMEGSTTSGSSRVTARQPKLRRGFISQLEIKNPSEALLLAKPESWALSSEPITVAKSIWFYDWLPCSGSYMALHVTSGSGLVIKRGGCGRDGSTDMDSGGISEANGHPNLCPFQIFLFLNPHLLVKSHLVGYLFHIPISFFRRVQAIFFRDGGVGLSSPTGHLSLDVPQIPCLQRESDWACPTFLTELCEDHRANGCENLP